MTMTGDDLPTAIRRYFSYLDDGYPDAAADQYALNAVDARPPAGDSDGQPRIVVHGREGVRAAFHRRGKLPKRHFISAAASLGAQWFVDGVVRSDEGEPLMGFTGLFTVDADALISRYVAFRCDPLPDSLAQPRSTAWADGAASMQRWLAARSSCDPTGVDVLAADFVYSDSSVRSDGLALGRRTELVGDRSAVQAELRGDGTGRTWTTRSYAQSGPFCFAEGRLGDRLGRSNGIFLLAATIDTDGRFSRLCGHICSADAPYPAPTCDLA